MNSTTSLILARCSLPFSPEFYFLIFLVFYSPTCGVMFTNTTVIPQGIPDHVCDDAFRRSTDPNFFCSSRAVHYVSSTLHIPLASLWACLIFIKKHHYRHRHWVVEPNNHHLSQILHKLQIQWTSDWKTSWTDCILRLGVSGFPDFGGVLLCFESSYLNDHEDASCNQIAFYYPECSSHLFCILILDFQGEW